PEHVVLRLVVLLAVPVRSTGLRDVLDLACREDLRSRHVNHDGGRSRVDLRQPKREGGRNKGRCEEHAADEPPPANEDTPVAPEVDRPLLLRPGGLNLWKSRRHVGSENRKSPRVYASP